MKSHEKPLKFQYKGSKYSKIIFNSCFFLVFLYWIIAFSLNGFDLEGVYFHCPEGHTVCANPFFSDLKENTTLTQAINGGSQDSIIDCNKYKEICETPYLVSGESIGTLPVPMFQYFFLFVLAVFGIGFLLDDYYRRLNNETRKHKN